MAHAEVPTDEAVGFDRLGAGRDDRCVDVPGRPHRRPGRLRRIAASLLVVLAVSAYAAAVPGVWARRNLLDSDRFVDQVAPLVDDPAVQEVLTARLTEQLMLLIDARALLEEVLPDRGALLAVPLTSAVEGFVHDRVEAFVTSERFAELWEGAATAAHTSAVDVLKGHSEVATAADGTVTLNLVPVIEAVLADITSSSPEILGRDGDLPEIQVTDVPEEAIARVEEALDVDLDDDFGQITVYDDGKLEAVQAGVERFDRLALVLLPAAIVFGGLALWLSDRRRRTVLLLASGVLVAMVLLRRVAFVLQDEVAGLPPTQEGRAATAVAVDTFLDPLLTFTLISAWAALAVIAGALLAGSSRWATATRSAAADLTRRLVATSGERAGDGSTVAHVRAHRDAFLAGGAVAGLVLLWTLEVSWPGLLLILGAVAALELAVYRLGGPDGSSAPRS